MLTPLSRFPEQTYALMRVVAGFLFFFHGAQKIFGAFGGETRPLVSLLGAAGVIEVSCGVLVMIGFWAGLAAFIASGEMAVAYFLRHQPAGLWPIENRGELAALYCFVFLFIAARGSGIWSVDGAISRPR